MKSFTLTITEADRQKADCFCSIDDCLIATAIRRRFPKLQNLNVAPDGAWLDGRWFAFTERQGPLELHFRFGATEKPFYNGLVVGRKIVAKLLIKRANS